MDRRSEKLREILSKQQQKLAPPSNLPITMHGTQRDGCLHIESDRIRGQNRTEVVTSVICTYAMINFTKGRTGKKFDAGWPPTEHEKKSIRRPGQRLSQLLITRSQ